MTFKVVLLISAFAAAVSADRTLLSTTCTCAGSKETYKIYSGSCCQQTDTAAGCPTKTCPDGSWPALGKPLSSCPMCPDQKTYCTGPNNGGCPMCPGTQTYVGPSWTKCPPAPTTTATTTPTTVPTVSAPCQASVGYSCYQGQGCGLYQNGILVSACVLESDQPCSVSPQTFTPLDTSTNGAICSPITTITSCQDATCTVTATSSGSGNVFNLVTVCTGLNNQNNPGSGDSGFQGAPYCTNSITIGDTNSG